MSSVNLGDGSSNVGDAQGAQSAAPVPQSDVVARMDAVSATSLSTPEHRGVKERLGFVAKALLAGFKDKSVAAFLNVIASRYEETMFDQEASKERLKLEGKERWLTGDAELNYRQIWKFVIKEIGSANLELRPAEDIAKEFGLQDHEAKELKTLCDAYAAQPIGQKDLGPIIKFLRDKQLGTTQERGMAYHAALLNSFAEEHPNSSVVLKDLQKEYQWQENVLSPLRTLFFIFSVLTPITPAKKKIASIYADLILKRVDMKKDHPVGVCYNAGDLTHSIGVEVKRKGEFYYISLANLGPGAEQFGIRAKAVREFQFNAANRKEVLEILEKIEYANCCSVDGKALQEIYDQLKEKGTEVNPCPSVTEGDPKIIDYTMLRPVQAVGNCALRNPRELSLHVLHREGQTKEANALQEYVRDASKKALKSMSNQELATELEQAVVELPGFETAPTYQITIVENGETTVYKFSDEIHMAEGFKFSVTQLTTLAMYPGTEHKFGSQTVTFEALKTKPNKI